MLKKIIVSISLSTFLIASTSPKKVNSYFEYDVKNGWWWYKEKYQEKDKTFETKIKMTSKEKLKEEKEDIKIKLLKQQNEKLSKIQERLEYAYPNITPIYTKNSKTGKKCLTNSSTDCFVFPLQAEAQHVPVMAKWLSKPNPKNSKEWLKWQAKYFNHLTDIGYGVKFAYQSGGDKAYPTNNIYSAGDSVFSPLTGKLLTNRRTQIIEQLKDKLTILMFLGKTTSLDYTVKADKMFYKWNQKFYKNWNFYFVFNSIKAKKEYEKRILSSGIDSNIEAWKDLVNKKYVIVKPNYFKKFNIKISPTTVALYTKDKKEGAKTKDVIWQKISTAYINPLKVARNTIEFLIYNKIIKPSEMSANKINNSFYKGVDIKADINESKIYKNTNKMTIGGK